MVFSKLWSRIVGLRGWNEEAAALHNVEGDGQPAPGVSPQTIVGDRLPGAQRVDDKQKYEEWKGEDPGH